jgi:hypothetical protein
MKKTLFLLSLWVLMGFMAACSTRVDLYADYKDVPVIYGLIDITQDTNYVKIIRAFSGSNDNPIDASQVALIADSSNYPGKLDARIVEYKNVYDNTYQPTGREIVLDTMTIHDKESGSFYFPNQKVYYTTAAFNDNTDIYKYQLVVLKGNDTVTSDTKLVGGENFRILTQTVTFTPDGYDKTGKINFTAADNGAVYELKLAFNYKEKKGNGPIVDKRVSWSYGTKGVKDLIYDDNHYSIIYNEATLFGYLSTAIGADTVNVERYIGPFEIYLSAGGAELYNYIQINAPSEGLSQNIPDYTNIDGGFGVFSSRINLLKTANLSSKTLTKLYGMNWGFKQQ